MTASNEPSRAGTTTVNLRARLGMDPIEVTPLTVIVVLSVNSGNGRRDVGVVVDSVDPAGSSAAAPLLDEQAA